VVSGDGTWRKRGFSSLYGVQTLIGNKTKQVLDVNVKSSYCQECQVWESKLGTPEWVDWLDSHIGNCQANYEGSAGGMEPAGVLEMFCRSKEKYSVFYTGYIGDGDSKTHKHVCDGKPYVEDGIEVRKLECVGHVQKRVGGNLRKMKKEGIVCADRKKLGGQGRLTDAVINDLQMWYGNAIRAHTESVEDMENAIWTSFHHIFSSDDHPSHDRCPKWEESWCKYQKAKANGKH